jgi:hypothetical protein
MILFPVERAHLLDDVHLLDHDEVEVVGRLSGEDAQTFVDLIDEVSTFTLSPEGAGWLKSPKLPPPVRPGPRYSQIRRRCLRSIYRICGRQALLPRSLKIPLCYDPKETPLYHGGFADVWKCQYNGQEVVAKVLRVYLRDDLSED